MGKVLLTYFIRKEEKNCARNPNHGDVYYVAVTSRNSCVLHSAHVIFGVRACVHIENKEERQAEGKKRERERKRRGKKKQ